MAYKTIVEFEAYLSRSQVKSIQVCSNGGELQIRCSLVTFKVGLDLLLIAAVSLGFYLMPDRNSNLIFIFALYAIVVSILWIDFNSINIITIDPIRSELHIKSRNVFKQTISRFFFKTKTHFAFADISSFTVRSNESFDTSLTKYFIDLKSANKTTKAILNFRKVDEAHETAKFLTDVIHL